MPKFFVSIRNEFDVTIYANDSVIAPDAATARYKVGCEFIDPESIRLRREIFGPTARDNLRGCRIIARRSKAKAYAIDK